MRALGIGRCLLAASLVLLLTAPAFAGVNGDAEAGGLVTRLSEVESRSLPQQPVRGSAGDRYEYRFEVHCSGDGTSGCLSAVIACAGEPGGGPLHDIFRRIVHPDASTTEWVRIGDTCFPPGSGGPQLTYTMIRDAFHLTPWAIASISTQPKGDVTLVGLKTFYQVHWSAGGYEPGEVDPVDPARMLGHRVEIRPRLVGVVYRFGDGSGFGPTTDLGGVWPDGGITHVYEHTGGYASHVEVTWSADFRVDGGAWTPIPETVTVPGPDTVVTVKRARAVLVG